MKPVQLHEMYKSVTVNVNVLAECWQNISGIELEAVLTKVIRILSLT